MQGLTLFVFSNIVLLIMQVTDERLIKHTDFYAIGAQDLSAT